MGLHQVIDKAAPVNVLGVAVSTGKDLAGAGRGGVPAFGPQGSLVVAVKPAAGECLLHGGSAWRVRWPERIVGGMVCVGAADSGAPGLGGGGVELARPVLVFHVARGVLAGLWRGGGGGEGGMPWRVACGAVRGRTGSDGDRGRGEAVRHLSGLGGATLLRPVRLGLPSRTVTDARGVAILLRVFRRIGPAVGAFISLFVGAGVRLFFHALAVFAVGIAEGSSGGGRGGVEVIFLFSQVFEVFKVFKVFDGGCRLCVIFRHRSDAGICQAVCAVRLVGCENIHYAYKLSEEHCVFVARIVYCPGIF